MAKLIATAVREELRSLIFELYPPIEAPAELEPHVAADHIVNGAPPSAGQDYTYRVGVYPTWPLSVFCRVTTNGTAGDRSVALEYRTGDNQRFLVAGSAVTIAASQQEDFCWQPAAGEPAWPVAGAALAALPQQWLEPGNSIIAITVSGGSAGDLIDHVRLALRY